VVAGDSPAPTRPVHRQRGCPILRALCEGWDSTTYPSWYVRNSQPAHLPHPKKSRFPDRPPRRPLGGGPIRSDHLEPGECATRSRSLRKGESPTTSVIPTAADHRESDGLRSGGTCCSASTSTGGPCFPTHKTDRGVPHPSRTLRRVGFHGPHPVRMGDSRSDWQVAHPSTDGQREPRVPYPFAICAKG
jgi:hypothetical protein